jgi:hypothetical protein
MEEAKGPLMLWSNTVELLLLEGKMEQINSALVSIAYGSEWVVRVV